MNVSGKIEISWDETGSHTKISNEIPEIEVREYTPGTSRYRFFARNEEWNVTESADDPAEAVCKVLARLMKGFKIGELEA